MDVVVIFVERGDIRGLDEAIVVSLSCEHLFIYGGYCFCQPNGTSCNWNTRIMCICGQGYRSKNRLVGNLTKYMNITIRLIRAREEGGHV